MITFYDNDFSTCAQKVRIALNEKGLQWNTVWLDLRAGDQFQADYLALNPAGVVPTLVIDGTVLVESTLILEYLEERYPQPRMMPETPAARHAVRRWMLRLDAGLHSLIGSLSIGVVFRHEIMAKGPDAVAAYLAAIPNRARRECWTGAIEKGTDDPVFHQALSDWLQVLELVEEALGESDWLVSDVFTLADLSMAPYLARLKGLGILGPWLEHRPRTAAWAQRIAARPAVIEAMDKIIKPNKLAFMAQCADGERTILGELIERHLESVV